MCIKAVVFDMDGVLIEAKDWHYDALNRALALFGHNISREDHVTRFDGLPTRDKLKTLSQETDLPTSLHETINQLKQEFTLEIVEERLQPNPIHEQALEKLREEGYCIGVASNSIRKSIETMLSKANLLQYLDFYLSNQDVTHGKPSPEIYQLAIQTASVTPAETLVVEDSPFGIRAAELAGAHVLQVHQVYETNYFNIRKRIEAIRKSNSFLASPARWALGRAA